MKRLLIASLALVLFVPVCALAQSAFSGTWETQLSSIRGMGKPVVVHLKDGMYECNCTPPINIKADGEDHAVKNQPGVDTMAVTVVNDHTIRMISKRAGKVVSDETITATPDGKTASYEFTDDSGTSTVTGKAMVERVAKGAASSNAVAGAWKFGHWEDLSANGRTFTYKIDGNTITFSDPTGDSYTAKIGGKAVPVTSPGNPGRTVAVKKVGNNELRETFARDGKVIRTSTMTVAANGKTMKSVSHNLQSDRSSIATADKQ